MDSSKPVPFGKYELMERISVGGMAEVFKARVRGVDGFQRFAAIKRILPNIAEDIEFITMFRDEAKIAGMLSHSNIAQIFDFGRVGSSYFISLEYINGRDLKGIFNQLNKRGEVCPVPIAAYLMSKASDGMNYAHKKTDDSGKSMKIVHRDVSPQNVLVSYEGEVKIVDFGIAKAADKASRTQAGILKGKFGYMSPEQVKGLPMDRRSDIFSMGIILFELVTGKRLFLGESDLQTLDNVKNKEIVKTSSIISDIDKKFDAIVTKALSRDIIQRYQWAGSMALDLQRYLVDTGQVVTSTDVSNFIRYLFVNEKKAQDTSSYSADRKTMLWLPKKVGEAFDEDLFENNKTEVSKPNTRLRTSVATPTPSSMKMRFQEPTIPPPIPKKKKRVSQQIKRVIKKPVKSSNYHYAEQAETMPSINIDEYESNPYSNFSDISATLITTIIEKKGRFTRFLFALLVLCCFGYIGYSAHHTGLWGMLGIRISIETIPPNVTILLDDTQVYEGSTPIILAPKDLASGLHTLKIKAPGYDIYFNRFDLKSGERISVKAELMKQRYGRLYVKVKPSDALVKVDGENVTLKNGLLEYRVIADRLHVLTVSADGYKPKEQDFKVTENELYKLKITLERSPRK